MGKKKEKVKKFCSICGKVEVHGNVKKCDKCKANEEVIRQLDIKDRKNERALITALKLERIAKDKAEADAEKKRRAERILLLRMNMEVYSLRFSIHKIIESIKNGENDRFIHDMAFYNIRNAPFELGSTPIFKLDFMPKFGDVKEHINGRTTFGTAALFAVYRHLVETDNDLGLFYKQHDVWIYATDHFNEIVIKPLQQKGGISAELYIEKLEESFGPLHEEAKEKFKKYFIYNKYGSMTRYELIELIREDLKKKEPKKKLIEIYEM